MRIRTSFATCCLYAFMYVDPDVWTLARTVDCFAAKSL